MFYDEGRGVTVHKFGLCWKTSSNNEFTERIALSISYNCLKFLFILSGCLCFISTLTHRDFAGPASDSLISNCGDRNWACTVKTPHCRLSTTDLGTKTNLELQQSTLGLTLMWSCSMDDKDRNLPKLYPWTGVCLALEKLYEETPQMD